VFLSSRPLYKRWPEKFVLAEEFAPLSDKGVRLTRPGEDLEEEEWEDVEEDEATYHTPTMRQAEPREEVPAAAGPPQGIPPGGPQGITEDDKLKRRKALLTRLDDMTLAELKGYAEEEEIPLHGAHKKEDIIAKIRQAEIG
jgi:hypothetical protein